MRSEKTTMVMLGAMLFGCMLFAESCSKSSETSADGGPDALGDVAWSEDGSGGDSDADGDGDGDVDKTCDPDACVPRTCSLNKEEASYTPADAGVPADSGIVMPESVIYWGHEDFNASVKPPTSKGILKIEIYPESSGGYVKLGPAEVALKDRETQYRSCGYCVRYFSNVQYDDDGGLANPDDVVFYMVCDGKLSIDSLSVDGGPDASPVLDGTLSATFVEVTIDDDFYSKPVEGGDSFCVKDLHFHAPISTVIPQ